MLGIMQDRPLLISSLIEHANRCHPHAEIVSRTVEGPIHRCTYADVRRRSKQVGEGAARARRRAGRPHRHARVERLPAPRALLRRLRHGRRAAHDQSAPVSRADRVHRQPRRGPVRVLRPDVRAAGREARAEADDGQGLRRDDRPRAHAVDRGPQPALLRGARRGAGRRLRVAELRRARPRRRCATRRARPAIPRACCTRTARRCCTRGRRARSTASGCRRRSRRCSSCRCSTSTPGACPTPAR